MPHDAKHRQSSRKRLDQLVYIELERGNGGMILDISEEGLSFRAIAPVESNSDVYFAFTIDGTRRLDGYGRLDWTEENGKVAGLEFTDVSREFRDAIQYWLTRMAEPAKKPTIPNPPLAAPLDMPQPLDRQTRRVESKPRSVHTMNSAEPRDVKTSFVDEPVTATFTDSSRTANPGVDLKQPLNPHMVPSLMGWDMPPPVEERPAPGLSPAAWSSVVAVLVIAAVLLFNSRQEVGRTLISLGKNMSVGSQPSDVNARKEPSPAPKEPRASESTADKEAGGLRVGTGVSTSDATKRASALGKSDARTPLTLAPLPQDREVVRNFPEKTHQNTQAQARAHDPAGQVHSLWAAVSQGNTAAEVTLARRYLVGEGVEKNCDQARVLFAAAAKKGRADAVQKLVQLDREGCP